MLIATLDDDDTQIEALTTALESAGHVSRAFRAARPLIHSLRHDTYDLLILDWNLPDLSGVEVLNWARSTLPCPPPALMLTSRMDEADIVAGPKCGRR